MTLWQTMLTNISKELQYSNYLRQPTIAKTVCPGIKINTEMLEMAKVANIEEALEDPAEGNPLISYEGKYSTSSMQQGYYELKRRELWGEDYLKDIKVITDIGAGYGNTARILDNLGYKGSHNFVDFSVMHDMQKRYLKSVKPEVDVNYVSIEDDLKGDLLIATFSIDEMPFEDREKLESAILNHNKVFIVHSSQFDGMDNNTYFDKLEEKMIDYDINRYNCPLYCRGNFFVATRKD